MAFSYSPKIVTDGLVLYLDAGNPLSYPGSGTTWTDLSRGQNPGTLINGPTFDSGNNGSIVFDGVDDYVDCGKQTTINNLAQSNMSIHIWANLSTSTPTSPRRFLSKRTPSGAAGWILAQDTNNNLNFVVVNSSNIALFYGTSLINTGTPLLLSAVYFSSTRTVKLYVNGAEETLSQNTPGTGDPADDSTGDLLIGVSYNKVNNQYIQGSIYTAQIYNRALTQEEITQNYNATKTRFGLT